MLIVWWMYLDVNCTKRELEAWIFYAFLVLKVPALGGLWGSLVSLAFLPP